MAMHFSRRRRPRGRLALWTIAVLLGSASAVAVADFAGRLPAGNLLGNAGATSSAPVAVPATSPILLTGGAISHAVSGVTAAAYTLANVTVNATGHVTVASSSATTGSGSVVLATSPTLVAPILGVASATSLTATGALPTVAAGQLMVAGNASNPTFGANNEGAVYSNATNGITLMGQGSATDLVILNKAGSTVVNVPTGTLNFNVNTLQDQGTNPTGTAASGYVRATSPTLVTPVLGVASATSLTLSTPLAVASGGTGDSGTAWTAYTPSLSCGTGTLTTSSSTGRSKTIGKMTFFTATATLTTVGTCATNLFLLLPNTGNNATVFAARETAVTGFAMVGSVTAASNSVSIAKYDNTFAPANGWVITISGAYENQ